MTKDVLTIENLSLAYDHTPVVQGVSLELQQGEVGCLLGPSGCGKTSLLRMIAGFEQPTHGAIHLNGRLLASKTTSVAPEDRSVGMVFQDFALFPHLTIFDNIAFGLRGQDSAKQKARVRELLQMIDLVDADGRYPHQLSGGQQQRVALARAMAPQPKVLLLDEPFSSLDSRLRTTLAADVRLMLKQTGTTALMVTHSQQEAFTIADTVGVMVQGALHQWGPPATLYHQPATVYVAGLTGDSQMVPATLEDDTTALTPLGPLRVQPSLQQGQAVQLLIRPEDILLGPLADNSSSDKQIHQAIITAVQFQGQNYLLSLQVEGLTLNAYAPHAAGHIDAGPYEAGQSLSFTLADRAYTVFSV